MPANEIKKILVMPAAGLGDFVMAGPVLRQLRACFPQSYIAVLAHYDRGAADIGAAMPYIDEVIDVPLQKYSWPAVIKFFLSAYWPMFFKLKQMNFDTVIILNPNPIRTIIVKMLRPKICLCPKVLEHPTRTGLELISQLGCSREPLDFGFKIPDFNLDVLLSPPLRRPWIGMHPFSGKSWWYWHGFEQQIEKLNHLGGTIFLLGKQPGHEPRKNIVDLVNRLNVTQLLALISKLDVLITSDSGPMHLGFAAGTPTVAIFGTMPPNCLMPLCNADKHCVIYHGSSPDFITVKERKPQKINPFDTIDADEVYECVMKSLRQNHKI